MQECVIFRIDVDMNLADEAELFRLESGASPSAATMIDGVVPSWGTAMPLAQMNMEAGAANGEADARAGQPVKLWESFFFRVRAQCREVGMRGWRSIVPIHTRATVVWGRSSGGTGSNGRISQVL